MPNLHSINHMGDSGLGISPSISFVNFKRANKFLTTMGFTQFLSSFHASFLIISNSVFYFFLLFTLFKLCENADEMVCEFKLFKKLGSVAL